MPQKKVKTSKSVLKRQRQAPVRRKRNRAVITALKTFVKKVRTSAEAKKPEEAKSALSRAISALDKAASKGIIHRNTAARRISRLTRLVHKIPA